MEYTKQLIEKAKHSRCRICLEHITELDADNQEFQSTKTTRGGTSSCTPDAGPTILRRHLSMKNKSVPRVTVCCDFRYLPTSIGNEPYRILPVAIVDGTVTNRKDPVAYAKEKRR